MICSRCNGRVTWRGPLSNLTHTECESCGGVNCQLPDDHEEETEMTDANKAANTGDDLDGRRYRRLRVLGVAPAQTEHLKNGNVLRFTNLDEFVDSDLSNYVRGEAALAPRQVDVEGLDFETMKKAVEYWRAEDEKEVDLPPYVHSMFFFIRQILSQHNLLAAAPTQSAWPEKLPCDVTIGAATFKKGISTRILIDKLNREAPTQDTKGE